MRTIAYKHLDTASKCIFSPLRFILFSLPSVYLSIDWYHPRADRARRMPSRLQTSRAGASGLHLCRWCERMKV